MWAGSEIVADAQLEASSTFQFPIGKSYFGVALFILAGALFSGILMIRAKRDRHYGYLAVAGVFPALIVCIPFLFWKGWISLARWNLTWVGSSEIQGAAAFAVGAVLAHLVWRATGPSRFEVTDG